LVQKLPPKAASFNQKIISTGAQSVLLEAEV